MGFSSAFCGANVRLKSLKSRFISRAKSCRGMRKPARPRCPSPAPGGRSGIGSSTWRQPGFGRGEWHPPVTLATARDVIRSTGSIPRRCRTGRGGLAGLWNDSDRRHDSSGGRPIGSILHDEITGRGASGPCAAPAAHTFAREPETPASPPWRCAPRVRTGMML